MLQASLNKHQGRRISEFETNSYLFDYGEAIWHTNSNEFSPSWAVKWTPFASL
jgi:hypothetical protein